MEEAPKLDPVEIGNQEMWGATPNLVGLSDDENKAVYEGTFDSVIERISNIRDTEQRDRLIQDLLSEIGTRQRELADQREIAESEWKNPTKVDEYQTSLDRLDSFQNKLLPLHDSGESTTSMADEISRQLENSKPIDLGTVGEKKKLNKFGELE